MNQLIIDGNVIRVNAQGLYSLNDLHKAAGGERRHEPANWTATAQAKELIVEITSKQDAGSSYWNPSSSPDLGSLAIDVKNGVGTYVCKELVYAYAMWVSAAFQLKVIRAYDRQVTQPQVAVQNTPLSHLAMESDWMLRMGYPTGVVQATIVERDDKYYNATGHHILSDQAIEFHKLNPSDSLTWDRGVEVTTRSAAAVALPHFVIHTVTEIARGYNRKHVTATVINNALTVAGYQVKLARTTYIKTALSEDYAQTRIRAQGTFRGLPIITGWKMHPEFVAILNKLTAIA